MVLKTIVNNQISALPEELVEDCNTKWDAFYAAAEAAQVQLFEDSSLITVIKYVFSLSDFVARSSIRNPEMINDLIKNGDLQKKYTAGEYNMKFEPPLWSLMDTASETELMVVLRRMRLREMVRIAFRDLAGWADFEETVTDLSNFADACINKVLSIVYDWNCIKYGLPVGHGGKKQYPVVIGMGKLGARELNFSSDIDIIFAYHEAGVTKGNEKNISNDEFFTDICRRFINIIGAGTQDGFVFRVDTRLRPYGDSGPIIMNFDSMEDYYQSQGRAWERYAWIKARVISNYKGRGRELLQKLKPFVFRKYFDYSAFDALRDMKRTISLEVTRKGMEDNIKLGKGGIREIEFFGQTFQLIRGGVTPLLQERSILLVLKFLALNNHISKNVFHELEQAYLFLRNTEHRLQEYADQQTHNLPSDQAGKFRLAISMGFSNWNSFIRQLQKHRYNVHSHFNKLLEPADSDTKGADKDKKNGARLENVWLGLIEEEDAKTALSSLGFHDPETVCRILDNLRIDSSTNALGFEGKKRLDKLIPVLLQKAGLSDNPVVVLNRLIDLIKTIQRRITYLSLLLENPPILTHLVKLADISPWIITFLSRHPVLLDELLDPRTLYSLPERSDLEKEISDRLSQISRHELEDQIQELCILKQINTLRIAAADVTEAVPLPRISDHLTDIAETVLEHVLELAWDYLVEKHGIPVSVIDGKPCEKGFAVIGYGKLGGIELGYGSDLDLVFLHAGVEGQTKGGSRPLENSQFYMRLGQRIIHILASHTPAGRLYEIDMRLRPNGSSGVIVSHMDAFRRYQSERAWTWEHQAIVRARHICGDACIGKKFKQVRKKTLIRPRTKSKLQQEVRDMRERMRKELSHPEPGIFDLKQDEGGIVDIEFLIQYLVLLKSNQYPGLAEWSDNIRIIETLIAAGIIEKKIAGILKKAYLAYRSAAHRFSLQEKPARVSEERFRDLRVQVKNIWNLFIGKP